MIGESGFLHPLRTVGNKSDRYLPMRLCFLVIALSLQLPSCSANQASTSADAKSSLTLAFLLGSEGLTSPLPMAAFTPPDVAPVPLRAFEGTLQLEADIAQGSIETLKDTFGIATDPQWKLTELPPFRLDFVSDGATVLPVRQTPQRTTHPYWELIVAPGKAWPDAQNKDWTRVSLPFALKERNQNCTHNGVLGFAVDSNGEISRVAWQISSETCLYLQVNLWGVVPARFDPGPIEARQEVIEMRRQEVSARLPVVPFGQLARDYPVADTARLAPFDTEDVTVHGFVIDGKHYRSNCQTRHGLYPYCDELAVPSYSLAKSIFAGLYYLHLLTEWSQFADIPVPDLVPECQVDDGRWDDVTMSDLINMTTGNYDEETFGKDEGAGKMQQFFLAESHAEKIVFSCEAWPRRSQPGSVAVYHTTDDYILGAAMTEWVRRHEGRDKDIYRDFLYPRLLEPLKLSPLMPWTQRTYDATAMPFTAYGLIMKANDLVRIAGSINSQYGEQSLFDQGGLDQALFRNLNELAPILKGRAEAYRNGFWGSDKAAQLGCKNETWIPFMSGYGGIIVALMPNGTIFYYFSDANIHRFTEAAVESNKIHNMCKETS